MARFDMIVAQARRQQQLQQTNVSPQVSQGNLLNRGRPLDGVSRSAYNWSMDKGPALPQVSPLTLYPTTGEADQHAYSRSQALRYKFR